ncbi:hypothetical protein [Micromonospora carbonacea]|uniref:Uncharacterized protein n=1 Tax=Micromonospora carbonacea TaxID=47853 RepID=A0A1C5AB63_9ACTN|nr:hypothetical protein [Micromonospora carbonacea]SCF42321.1 hypothetical protein GA0070563_11265 [Micromonospora carbonacea]
MATAYLTATPAGLHLRLSNRGFTFDSFHITAVADEDATTTADRLLADHGWKATDGWEQQRTGGVALWAALIDAKEQ